MTDRSPDDEVPPDSPMGELSEEGPHRRVVFVRDLAATPDQVWSALTDPRRLVRWLAETTIDPRPGGRVRHDFGDDGTCEGTITIWEPPVMLEYGWAFEGNTTSVVRFELKAVGPGTRLTLVHRDLGEFAAGYGAGWHAYLDRLTAEVHGAPMVDWDERFAAVLPRYRMLTG